MEMFPETDDEGANEKRLPSMPSILTSGLTNSYNSIKKIAPLPSLPLSPTARKKQEKQRNHTIKPKKNQRPFLTSSQLSDLFCRLDRNGDGELDLDEFTGIIRMLKLDVNEDFISKVFRAVDTSASGVIEMQEFICAYQKIYCKHESSRYAAGAISGADEFVRVTRYGTDEDGERVFELYTLSNDPKCGHNKKTTFNFETRRRSNNTGFSTDHFDACTTEEFKGNLEDLNKLMVADNKQNYETDSRLMWWVDICMKNVERSKVSKYVDIFGLPNNSKFLSGFGNFGNSLPKDPKSRIFIGNGVTVEGNVTSYSAFNQAITLLDTPVVHHLPSWIQNRIVGNGNKPTPIDYIARYYTTRFAFLFNLTGLSDSRKNEKAASYESAAGIVTRFRGEIMVDSDDSDAENDEEQEEKGSGGDNTSETLFTNASNASTTGGSSPKRGFFGYRNKKVKDDYTILQSHGRALPLPHKKKHKTPPTWTLSNSQLAKRPPVVRYDTFSMHILENQSKGANCLVSIRKMDDEAAKYSTMESKSRSGVLGRIFDGVWMKLMNVVGVEGSADVAGELDDAPATLMAFISALTHSYSMRTLGTIDSWMATVEKEVKDVVVSKHSGHVKELERVIKECISYVDPIHQIFVEFVNEWERESAKVAEDAALLLPQLGEVGGKRNIYKRRTSTAARNSISGPPIRSVRSTSRASIDSLQTDGGYGPNNGPNSNSNPGHISSNHSEAGEKQSNNGRDAHNSIYNTNNPYGAAASAAASANINTTEIEHLPLSYKLIKRFYNSSIHRDIKIVIDGYELLDMKGLTYWKERLDKYSQRLTDIKELICTQLDEKRNFTSFTLTIVTTLLAPLAILTGYFGMNFDNMDELHPETWYKSAPGVYLMWYVTAFAYGCMFVMAMHFRIIYSAT